MSDKKLSDRQKHHKANPHLKSSIVHKPFATGTINIFNPHRRKASSKASPPKVFVNAELEKTSTELATRSDLSDLDLEFSAIESPEIEYRVAKPHHQASRNWIDNLLSPWGISAIFLLFLVNLISAGFIWRNARLATNSNEVSAPVSSVGNRNFAAQEFVPLNLSTLGTIKTAEDEVQDSSLSLSPISPALAPLNDIASLSSYNTPYHYVMTEYTGEESLTSAQQKVKQISLVNFPQGVSIYMGAFKERQDAEQFVSQLQQDNFSAYVYPLD